MSAGDADYASSRRRLSRWVVAHPVLWDRGNANANAKNYGVREWPSDFLSGPDGRVAWQGNPAATARDKDTEAAFRDLLDRHLRLAEAARR